MKERPIIFNSDMVRAVLDGRKTQTRRIVNGVPSSHDFHGWVLSSTSTKDEGKACWAIGKSPLLKQPIRVRCPFGEVGDLLWVREAFFPAPLEIQSDPPRETNWNIAYRGGAQLEKTAPATYNPTIYNYERWTPSIHMPRWASRIALEITGVRVERLWDITEDDAKAEGCTFEALRFKPGTREVEEMGHTAVYQFGGLWQSIYGDESWQANPWVWVIEFKPAAGQTKGSSISSTSSEP